MNGSRNTSILIASFLASLPLWLGVNAADSQFQRAFFIPGSLQNPEYITASISQASLLAQKQPPLLQLNARAALSIFVDEQGNASVLFEKDSSTPFPIASITKLMTALVVKDHLAPDQDIPITIEAVLKEEDTGNLKVGQVLDTQNLLASLLIESSNDAAVALAHAIGQDLFLKLMNEKASALELTQSSFSDVAGVDPNHAGIAQNRMSAKDVAQLASFIMKQHPDIADILATPRMNIYSSEGTFHHSAATTNALLHDKTLPAKILMGKTGWTPSSRGCLLLVTEHPEGKGYLVNVILGSDDRFFDMKRLIQWVAETHEL